MTVYYFDPEGGNDANDGLSFANRKQFWTGFSPSGDDELRIMAARDPYSLGDGQWTNGSNVITLAAAKTVEIDDCDTAWTASANVTATASTLSNNFTQGPQSMWREGTGYARLVIATAFTTGKVAYRTLPSTLDLSGYTAVSMRFGVGSAITAGQLQLVLCSDSTGDTPVATFNLPAFAAAGHAVNLFMEFGGALPANVNSIAVYATTDPGAATFGLDNIIACQSRGHADHICHESVIGKMSVGEPEWWPIKAIVGANIIIGDCTATGSAMGRQYSGATETVAVYTYQTQHMQASGTPSGFFAGARITGGWNRTDMSTQTGETVLAGRGCYVGSAFRSTGPVFSVTRVSYVGFQSPVGYVTLAGTIDFQGSFVAGCVSVAGDSQNVRNIEIDYCTMNRDLVTNGGGNIWNTRIAIKCKLYGESSSSTGFFSTATEFGVNPSPTQMDIAIEKVRNNATCVRNGAGTVRFRDTEFVGNAEVISSSAFNKMATFLHNCKGFSIWDAGTGSDCFMTYTKAEGDERVCGYISYLLTCRTQLAVVPPTGDTAAWRFSWATNNVVSAYPLVYPISRFFAESGKTYSITYDGRRNNANIAGLLRIVDDHNVELGRGLINAAINTWAAGSFEFTATEDGFVDLELGGYGSAGWIAYAANITISEV